MEQHARTSVVSSAIFALVLLVLVDLIVLVALVTVLIRTLRVAGTVRRRIGSEWRMRMCVRLSRR